MKSVSPLPIIEKSVSTRPLYPLDYPAQEIKRPVKNLPPEVVRSILDWAFYFLTAHSLASEGFMLSMLLFPSLSRWGRFTKCYTAYLTPYVLYTFSKQEYEPKEPAIHHGAFKHQYHAEPIRSCFDWWCENGIVTFDSVKNLPLFYHFSKPKHEDI